MRRLVEPVVLNRGQFAGAKPARFTHWVLGDLLGARPGDSVDDLFPGTGAVQTAIDGFLRAPMTAEPGTLFA
jgi:hypothetical protein